MNQNFVMDIIIYLYVHFFADERNLYLAEVPPLPDIHQLISLFKSTEKSLLIKLAQFGRLIMTTFEHRDVREDGI